MSTASIINYARSKGHFATLPELSMDRSACAKRKEQFAQLQTGMRPEELQRTCALIEASYQKWVRKKRHVAEKLDPQVPYTLEYDPITSHIYIHLDTYNIKMLGIGGSKYATYSLLYNQPQFVAQITATVKANSSDYDSFDDDDSSDECEKDLIKERSILRELNGLTGIVRTYTITPRSESEGGTVEYSWVQKLYNLGSIADFEGLDQLSIHHKITIAADLIEGMMHAHKRGIILDDANMKNWLLHSENGKMEAVITDFGLAYRLYEKPERLESSISHYKFLESPDPKTAATRRRVQCELVQDGTPPGFGFYNFKEEVVNFALDLLVSLFDEAFSATIDSQTARHALEDARKKNQKPFSKEQELRFILLKLASWSHSQAYTLEEAVKRLRTLSTRP